MLEVVFSESAAGSMSIAMSERSYADGPVGVACISDDGSQPSQAEIRKAQEEYEERQRQNWAEATPLEGSREDIMLFSLALSVGEIDEDGIGSKRENALRFLISTYPPSVEEVVQTKLENARKSLKTLLDRASKGEPIRVWSSYNADETCGTYWLMDQLGSIGFENLDVTLVKLPEFRKQLNGTVVQYTGWGEVAPHQWGKMAEFGEKLPTNYMRAMENQWKQLRKENAPLRAVLNDTLVSAPENLYDSFILREIDCQEDEFMEAKVVGSVLGKYQLGLGDTWVAMRIEKFIQEGLLQPLTCAEDDWPIYHRMVRKCK